MHPSDTIGRIKKGESSKAATAVRKISEVDGKESSVSFSDGCNDSVTLILKLNI